MPWPGLPPLRENERHLKAPPHHGVAAHPAAGLPGLHSDTHVYGTKDRLEPREFYGNSNLNVH